MSVADHPLGFCPQCGTALQPHRIADELRQHGFCTRCQQPHYQHPQIVVTCFVACERRLLLVRRAIEPKRGCWAIPGGYLEAREASADGAARELREETGIVIPASQLSLYMTGTLTFINQVYLGFRATVATPASTPGVESLECGFFSREQCPWERMAYPEVNESIVQAYDDLDSGQFSVWHVEMSADSYQRRAVATGPHPHC